MSDAASSVKRPAHWQEAFDLIATRGHERREEPFRLASGQLSHDYIDGKFAIDTGERLTVVSRAVAELAELHGIDYDAVGGLTMGADPLAHGVAMVTGKAWFSVRKEQKKRGREQWIEGTRLEPGTRVLLVDDVLATGGTLAAAARLLVRQQARLVGGVVLLELEALGGRALWTADAPLVALLTR